MTVKHDKNSEIIAKENDITEGYLDGFSKDAIKPNDNRSQAYTFGWYNGRDDRSGKPRTSPAKLREELKVIMSSRLH